MGGKHGCARERGGKGWGEGGGELRGKKIEVWGVGVSGIGQ